MGNKLDRDYQELVKDILVNGYDKGDRTGTGTKSVFGRQIRHKMSDGFPLLTTKKMAWKSMVTELIWFLRGDTNIKYLVDNGCNIWNGDAYKHYEKEYEKDNSIGLTLLVSRIDGKHNYRKPSIDEFIDLIKIDDEFAKKWGELGPIYGKQWRDFNGYLSRDIERLFNGQDRRVYNKGIDQIQNLINDLKTNPDSRRLMVNAWNVGELDQMVLPPCHYGFQIYTRELSEYERRRFVVDNFLSEETAYAVMMGDTDWDRVELEFGKIPKREISLIFNQRSVDTGLGLPFNIASYGLLLVIIAKIVNMVPGELIGNLGDTHLYNNHLEPIQEQLEREPFKLPNVYVNDEFWHTESSECGIGNFHENFDYLINSIRIEDFTLENYQSHPTIKLPLSN